MVQPQWKIVWQFLKNLNTELPYYHTSNSTPSVYPKELKTGTQTSTRTHMFTAALLPIAERRKQPKCPSTDE